jgi:hypothetical protein
VRQLGIPNHHQLLRRVERELARQKNRAHGRWHIVGATGEPAFQNGTTNSGGTWLTTRFRWSLGGGWEYIVNVNPPAVNAVCFTLPAGFYDPNGDTPIHGFDDQGSSLSFKIDSSNGDVVFLGP